MPLSRTNSICPTPEDELLNAVLIGDINKVVILIKSNGDLLKSEYADKDRKNILLVALTEENIESEVVRVLIENGADLDVTYFGKKPIHLAAIHLNSDVLKQVLQHLTKDKVNEVVDGKNALHILIEWIEDNKDEDDNRYSEENYLKNVELLLIAGIKINQGNARNQTPILLAAKNGFKQIIKLILEYKGGDLVDLDTHKLRGKTARDLITAKNLYQGNLPEDIIEYDVVEKLLAHIKDRKEDDFIALFEDLRNKEEIVNSDNNGSSTLLQLSCEKNLPKIVKILLNNGADVNLVTKNSIKPPIEIAAGGGYYKVVQVLLESPRIIINPNTLCFVIKHFKNNEYAGVSYRKCCESILKATESRKILNVNAEDDSGNTAIHYSLRYANEAVSQKLLELGATLASKNKFEVMPITDIDPHLLENHLDHCIKFNVEEKNYEKPNFQVTFDYQTLLPQQKIRTNCEQDPENLLFSQHTGSENSKNPDGIDPEMDVISHMSQAPELKHLMKHPVIVSFLFLKWHRIRCLFYANLIFYVIFVASLISYIFFYYANTDYDKMTDSSVNVVIYFVLIIAFFTLVARETFQMLVSPSNYFRNFENLIEIILIIVTGMILFIADPSNDTRKQLSSIAILLAAIELILMFGQHPILSTHVVMLKTVSTTFFKLLVWYSPLIIAFALSFNILFAKLSDNKPPTNSTENENEDLFTGPGKSIFKTIVMLTGEFDAGSINFQTYPVTSKLIFTLFVFMITIILLNLLNGLAVSDTQAIKNDAELVGHIARAKHIHYVETMILGSVFPSGLVNILKNLCCCLPIDEGSFYINFKRLARNICVFPNADRLFYVLPNNGGRIFLDINSGTNTKKKYEDTLANDCFIYFTGIHLDKETIKRINLVIEKNEKERCQESTLDSMKKEQEELKRKIDQILTILNNRSI